MVTILPERHEKLRKCNNLDGCTKPKTESVKNLLQNTIR